MSRKEQRSRRRIFRSSFSGSDAQTWKDNGQSFAIVSIPNCKTVWLFVGEVLSCQLLHLNLVVPIRLHSLIFFFRALSQVSNQLGLSTFHKTPNQTTESDLSSNMEKKSQMFSSSFAPLSVMVTLDPGKWRSHDQSIDGKLGKGERKEKSQSRRPSQGRHVFYSVRLRLGTLIS